MTKAGLPNWDFRFSDGRLIAEYHEGMRGYGNTKERVWNLDDQNRITDGLNKTSSIEHGRRRGGGRRGHRHDCGRRCWTGKPNR